MLFLLVSVFSQAFFALVGRHLMSFFFFPAWHNKFILKDDYFTFFFTSLTKVFAGLKEGMECSGIIMVVFLEMFLFFIIRSPPIFTLFPHSALFASRRVGNAIPPPRPPSSRGALATIGRAHQQECHDRPRMP